ncbi:MAG: rod shape-determining protein MreC [Paludibacteraceae bacterium]|nr:rod shape-determining protein MreC [Paludibacteraceae bacterium]
MRNLLNFLIKISPLLLFLALETVAVVLMVQRSRYHSYAIISTSNVVSGGLLEASNSVTSYFSLSSVNERLALENSIVRNENEQLKSIITEYEDIISQILPVDSSVIKRDTLQELTHIPAKVIGNTVNKLDNYITLDKGAEDGIKPDMGVICDQGVVGIISTVSKHFSVVLPIINSQSRISCRLDSSRTIGSIVWNGLNPSYASLMEIPRHVFVTKGEKIYTSGFSYIFPEGIPVGVVEEAELKESDSFYKIKVSLSTSFYTLSHVDVISFAEKEELDGLKSVMSVE